MQRKLGFQQQCYGDDGMWMDTQAQQHNYAFHEESWNSDNNYHKQFPGMMHMKPGAFAMESDQFSKHHGKLGGSSHGMFQEIRPGGHGYGHHHHVHGGGKNFPHGVANATHHFSNGGVKFKSGGHHHDYLAEESEYEAYGVEHHGAAPARIDEMRYERHHNYGGDHGFYANPYDRKMQGKPNKVEWTAKGV
ncbi:uncharacterized protein LOC133317911 [Gastrolobium bilobum]|uniref:uncharacterized protein LOC133317911 n=1 Tax=Gastrolobium bilobum TaxID=150636 RepID=UPI002AAFE7BE|nr:uncharacterized protein LOC133317911 [Gastrolobium bilobum]